jgi:hypothetical protein
MKIRQLFRKSQSDGHGFAINLALMKFSRAISRVNHLTRLIARENLIILSRRASNKSQAWLFL